MIFYPAKVFQYFKDNYVLGKRSPKGWYNFQCPFCGKDKKAAIHLEIQYVKCWSCGAASNVAEFVQETEHVDYYQAKQILNSIVPSSFDLNLVDDIEVEKDNTELTLPDGWQSILDGVGNLGDRARAALQKRGFDLEELDFKGFGYCNKHHEDKKKDFYGYIIIPFKKDGVLSYYIGRDFMGNFLRYKNPPSNWVGIGKGDVIYNEEALYLYKTIYIVEGWSDAQMIGKRGTATLGWDLSRTQLDKYMKCGAKNLIFIPDGGVDNATGQTYYQKAVQTATSFLDKGVNVAVVDLNPFKNIGKDICEIGWEIVHKHFKQNTELLNWGSAMEIITK